jgi:hypothetical protein
MHVYAIQSLGEIEVVIVSAFAFLSLTWQLTTIFIREARRTWPYKTKAPAGVRPTGA